MNLIEVALRLLYLALLCALARAGPFWCWGFRMAPYHGARQLASDTDFREIPSLLQDNSACRLREPVHQPNTAEGRWPANTLHREASAGLRLDIAGAQLRIVPACTMC
jgi:hypothetical protein